VALDVVRRRLRASSLEDVAVVGEHAVRVRVDAVAVLVQVARVTGMYFALPVVPLVVANMSGSSAVSMFGSPRSVRSMYGLSDS